MSPVVTSTQAPTGDTKTPVFIGLFAAVTSVTSVTSSNAHVRARTRTRARARSGGPVTPVQPVTLVTGPSGRGRRVGASQTPDHPHRNHFQYLES